MKFRSPLSKALGSGSAKHGFSHWWLQRVSAIALIPLTLWFVYSMVCLSTTGYYEAVEWLSSPFNCNDYVAVYVNSVVSWPNRPANGNRRLYSHNMAEPYIVVVS